MADLVFKPDAAAFARQFESPTGMVGRDLRRRGNVVLRAAKVQVGVETGRLRRELAADVQHDGRNLHVRIGVWAEPGIGYAYEHHQGTRPHMIQAPPGHHLRFSSHGAVSYTRMVRHPGTRPNRYLLDNLPLGVA